MNRQKLILFVLLVLLVLALAWSYLHVPRQKRVGKASAPSEMRTTPAKEAVAMPQDENKLHLDALERTFPRFSGYRRNIFQPLFHAQVKFVPPIPKPPLPPPVAPALPAVPVPPPPPPTPEQLVQQDMAQYTFLGFLQKGSKKIIFLSQSRGQNKEILLVKKGDNLSGKYIVANITDEAMTIKAISGGTEVILPLVENKALASPSPSRMPSAAGRE